MRLERGERVAQVRGDADVGEASLARATTASRRRPRPSGSDVERGVTRRGERELARVARAEHADASVRRAPGRACETPPRRRRTPRAPSRAAGRPAARPTPRARRRTRSRRPRPAAMRGRDRSPRSSRSGVRVSEASVTTGVPISGGPGTLADRADGAGQDPARVGRGVVHLAPRGDDLEDAGRPSRRRRPRALGDLAMRRRVEAEALDRDLELVRRHGPEGSSRSAGCGRKPGGPSDAVGAERSTMSEPIASHRSRGCGSAPEVHLHERSLGSYARGLPPSRASSGQTFLAPCAVPGQCARSRWPACERPRDARRLERPPPAARAGRRGLRGRPHARHRAARSAPSGSARSSRRRGARLRRGRTAPGRRGAPSSTIPAMIAYLASAWEEWHDARADRRPRPGPGRPLPLPPPRPGRRPRRLPCRPRHGRARRHLLLRHDDADRPGDLGGGAGGRGRRAHRRRPRASPASAPPTRSAARPATTRRATRSVARAT